jgi:hypothetical protein
MTKLILYILQDRRDAYGRSHFRNLGICCILSKASHCRVLRNRQELKNWLTERLTDYQYSKDDISSKVDDISYKFTDREKEGMAVVKEMLNRISFNVLLSES